ncbi:hypothetical protein DL546_001268 [Coniochaeta pulveracea]|uniref:LysM domain-containing protein n=1 Tax=Coniochaeta pulveracea TaxID=177199 RepID=A0A420Y0T7_9PEZI|nr:hypothetical protein DL546_001268 [Coniochaeta pulveracea]
MGAKALQYFLAICLCFGSTFAQFNLYPGVNADKLAKALNTTTACISALNRTLPSCDQTLLQMTQNLENYWWTDSNLTAICSTNCSQEVTFWSTDALADCDNQYYTAYGKLVPIWEVTDRFRDSVDFACMESWSDDYDYCLTESQEWVGADVSGLGMTDPTQVRMATLYNDTTLCNSCFLDQLFARVTSPYLPDTDHSDYLVDQIFDVYQVCNVTLPDFTVRALDWYDLAPPLTSTYLGSSTTSGVATATGSAPAATTTCLGQSVSSGTGCDALATKYGVGTGALQYYSNSDNCTFTTAACLPSACKLQQVQTGDTCASLAAAVGGNTTLTQFLKWNPYVMGLCDSLTAGQYICMSSPGTTGTYTLAPPPLGTDAGDGNQQRGGAGGIVTPTTTATDTWNPISGGAAPSPTQDGLVTNCNNYASAVSGQGCYDFATSHGIQPTQLYAWNPVLGLSGSACATALWASEYYCIGTWTTTSTTVIAPGPTQTGIASNCNKYAAAIKDDVCSVFASRNSISLDQLYAWNAVLGTTGQNCGSSLWAGEYYCVGVSASGSTTIKSTSATTTSKPTSSSSSTKTTSPTSKTSSTTKVQPAGPTQTGIVATCNKYATPATNQGCYDFAVAQGITQANLYKWNPVLGPNGENCGTQFWYGEYYCVGSS